MLKDVKWKKLEKNNVILSVYIINATSGLCIVSWSRLLKKLDASLISGFLLAISSFGREIGGEAARYLDYGEKKFLFASKDDLIFVLELTSAKDVEMGRRLLQQIINSFYREYGGTKELTQSINISFFLPFREKLEQIISSQVIELEKRLEEIQTKSKASDCILLSLGGGVLSTTSKHLVKLSETFSAGIKMVLNSHEATTGDSNTEEFIIHGNKNTMYVRRVFDDTFLLIRGPKEMAEGLLKVLVQRHINEIANVLTTIGYSRPKKVATETIIHEFINWSSQHSILSELRLQDYTAQLETMMKGQQGLYEFDCVLKSQNNIAFIRVYSKQLGQSDVDFIQRFVKDSNKVFQQLDFTPVSFFIISLDDFTEGAREVARKAIIRYKDMYFHVILCKHVKEAPKPELFQIIEGL